jgi:hypothetical protein
MRFMIKAPACKICGGNHWGPGHVWPDRVEPVRPIEVPVKPGRTRKPLDELSEAELRAKVAERREKVRGYVRSHRARKKAEG